MQERYLITGSTGLLGSYLCRFRPPGCDLITTSLRTPPIRDTCVHVVADLLDADQITRLFRTYRPTTVIHCAAEGRVDRAETEHNSVYKLNVELPETLAATCRSTGAHFVFVSSNAVFGAEPGPYSESSPYSPVNEYGRMKVEAETRVLAAGGSSLLFRPILMYGWPSANRRTNVVAHWINQLSREEQIFAVSNTFTQPLYAGECADIIWRASESRLTGSLNVSGGTTLSFLELAKAVCHEFNFDDSLVVPIDSSGLKEVAPRPSVTEFDMRLLNLKLGITTMTLSQGLRRMHIESSGSRE